MKQILQGRFGSILLTVLGAAVVVYGAWKVFDLGKVFAVASAISDIEAGRNVGRARAELEAVNDRAYVLDRLERALLDEGGTVQEKTSLLDTLDAFAQPRTVRRAIESASLPAQRAACKRLRGVPELKERCKEIALAWLRDEGADERHQAAIICGELKVEEARPLLLEIAGSEPRNPREVQLFQFALNILREDLPPELIERLFARVADAALSPDVRNAALTSLEGTKGASRERLRELALSLLRGPDAPSLVRMQAALVLRKFPDEAVCAALEETLLDEKFPGDRRERTNRYVIARNCLRSLGEIAPIERIRKLALDRRVYQHPYFGVRMDVATILAALNVREGIAIDILCDYLVDTDDDDKERIVRLEGWLSLWTITGTAYGIPETDLFRTAPRAFPDPDRAREYLFKRAFLRSGVSTAQVEAVQRVVPDLARMQAIRQVYGQSLKAQILEQWRADAEKAAPQDPGGK